MPDDAKHTTELWPAERCAAHRGVPQDEWERQVFAGREPIPAVNDGTVRLWDAHTVRTWRHHGQLHDDEWFVQQCAAFHEITVRQWKDAVKEGRAPAPKRKIGAYSVWDKRAARAPLKAKPDRAPIPDPPEGQWTAEQCARFVGVGLPTWKSALKDGRAPAPERVDEYGRPLWPRDVIQHLLLPLGRREGEWTADQAAKHLGITRASWASRVRTDECAPKPTRRVGKEPLWDKAQVQQFKQASHTPLAYVGPDLDAPSWTAKECADFLGIAPRLWRAAVKSGEAPQPSGHTKGRTQVWDPNEVRAFRESQERS